VVGAACCTAAVHGGRPGALAERDVTWLVMVMGWDGVCAALDEGVATAAQLRL
jgi:hypothetical protein